MKRIPYFTALLLTLLLFQPAAYSRSRHKKTWVDQAEQELDEALVSAPQDSETCFSPDEPCDIKLKKFIASAQKSLDIAIYDINHDSIVHAILIQSKKMTVRIVVDRRQAKEKNSLVPLLVQAGAQVRYGHQRGIMHNKFTIVDGKTVELGSFNYTHHASRANNENQVYLANPKIVERFQKRFEKIWSEATPVS